MSLNGLFQSIGGEWKREIWKRRKKEEENEKGYITKRELWKVHFSSEYKIS